MDTIQKLKWTFLPRPPYSPDIASSVCHPFGPLKEDLGRNRFCNDEEMIQDIQEWVATLVTIRLVPEWHLQASGPLAQVYFKPGRLC